MELGFGIFRLNYWFLVEVDFFFWGVGWGGNNWCFCCVIEDKMELGFGNFRLISWSLV